VGGRNRPAEVELQHPPARHNSVAALVDEGAWRLPFYAFGRPASPMANMFSGGPRGGSIHQGSVPVSAGDSTIGIGVAAAATTRTPAAQRTATFRQATQAAAPLPASKRRKPSPLERGWKSVPISLAPNRQRGRLRARTAGAHSKLARATGRRDRLVLSSFNQDCGASSRPCARSDRLGSRGQRSPYCLCRTFGARLKLIGAIKATTGLVLLVLTRRSSVRHAVISTGAQGQVGLRLAARSAASRGGGTRQTKSRAP